MPPLLETFMELSFRINFQHWHHILLAVFHVQKPWSFQCGPNFERATSNCDQNQVTNGWGVLIQVQYHTVAQWTHRQCPARYDIAMNSQTVPNEIWHCHEGGTKRWPHVHSFSCPQSHVDSPVFLHTRLDYCLFLSEQTSFWSFSTYSLVCSFK